MKFRLIYILLTALLFTGNLFPSNKQVEPVSVSHTGIQLQRDAGQMGALIPDLPVQQFILDEDDRDEDDFSSLLRKPLVNRTVTVSPRLHSFINDPLTAFRKNYLWSVYPVSDIYIVHRSFRI